MLLEHLGRSLLAGASCPEEWSCYPEGAFLAQREQEIFDNATAEVFGYHALQVGDSHRDLLCSSPILHKLRVGRAARCDVCAEAGSLPFGSGSVDLVALVHILEFSGRARDIVRDSFRVLRPEGHMVVLCFNAASMLGLRRMFDMSGGYPLCGEFYSVQRLADWLGVLGMAVVGGCYTGYSQARTPDWLRTKLEAAGDRWWPLFGNVVMLHAVKRQLTVRMMPLWSGQKRKAQVREAVAGTSGGRGGV